MQFWEQSRADGNVLDSVIRTLKDRYGLLLRSPDRANLEQFLADRSAIAGGWAHYGSLIAGSSPASVTEWQRIIAATTNTESYFFRDRGQFTLLEQTLLPALIAHHHHDRTLRLWSAACAGGEEAYSLAMLVCELIPDLDRWQVQILGTDINTEAMARAEQGWFREWSFRAIDPQRWQRYFEPIANGWRIVSRVRQLVTFQPFNLAHDSWRGDRDGSVDLILCRNVFIYFDPEAIAPTLTTFAQALKPGGYLLTGHAELYGQPLQAFEVQLHPQSVVYRRPVSCDFSDGIALSDAMAAPPMTAAPSPASNAAPGREPIAPTLPLSARSPFPISRLPGGDRALGDASLSNGFLGNAPVGDISVGNTPVGDISVGNAPVGDISVGDISVGDTSPRNLTPLRSGAPAAPRAIAPAGSTPQLSPHRSPTNRSNFAEQVRLKLEELLKIHPNSSAVLYALACLHANIGLSNQALDFCQKALDLDPNSIEICCLMARIWEEQNDFDRAKQFLRRAIYLDREAVHPKLELASLYDRTGDPDLANRLYRTVLTFIDQPASLCPGVTGITRAAARALADRLRHRLLADLESG